MAYGVENGAKSLNDIELKAAKNFIENFKNRIGRENKIAAADIEMHYRNLGYKLSGPRIRAIINHIRNCETIKIGNKKYFIISDSTGFWLSANKEEITRFADSLEQRAGTILTIKQAADSFLGIARANSVVEENQGKLF